jgi:hypothetical protein
MPATVTTLTREIAREERCVGIRSDAPLTPSTITRRRTQLIAVLAGCGFVALFAIFAAAGGMQMIAVSLAGAFGIYAIEQDHHLRRLALLRVDSERISLHVASELMYSGALAHDRELFDLRDRAGVIAGELAVELAEVVPAACTRVRLLGPSGEMPIAAEQDVEAHPLLADDPTVAAQALRAHTTVRRDAGGHSVLAVPIWRGDDAVALLEAVSREGAHYNSSDAARVDAFAHGAMAALRAVR